MTVKLPEILESVKIEEETLIKLQHEIIGLLKYVLLLQAAFTAKIFVFDPFVYPVAST